MPARQSQCTQNPCGARSLGVVLQERMRQGLVWLQALCRNRDHAARQQVGEALQPRLVSSCIRPCRRFLDALLQHLAEGLRGLWGLRELRHGDGGLRRTVPGLLTLEVPITREVSRREFAGRGKALWECSVDLQHLMDHVIVGPSLEDDVTRRQLEERQRGTPRVDFTAVNLAEDDLWRPVKPRLHIVRLHAFCHTHGTAKV
mmetsp:Transcript_55227/g.133209  ORF Transcript_55227/g.133209 Transcript_55227/m.133209 type:complete len:202 (+) Transcript_55227:37-642(+)